MQRLSIYWICTQYRFKLCPLVWSGLIHRLFVELSFSLNWAEIQRLIGGETYLDHWVLFFVTLYYPLCWAVCQKTGWKSPASSTWDYAFLVSQPWVMACLAERFQEGPPLLPKHKPFHSSPFISPRATARGSQATRETKIKAAPWAKRHLPSSCIVPSLVREFPLP